MESAVALHKEGRLEEAARAYKVILDAFPGDFEATHLLGVVALQQGEFDHAQEWLTRALELRPHDESALNNLGTTLLRGGSLDKASEVLQFALRLHPHSAVVAANAGTVLHHQGRYRDSIPLLRKAHEADSGAYAVSILLGASLLKCGEAQEAADIFGDAVRASSSYSEGWSNLAIALGALGRHADASEAAAQAVSLQPKSAATLGVLAAALVEEGKTVKAAETYRKAVAYPDATASILLDFAGLLLSVGEYDEAVAQLRQVKMMDPRNLVVRWALALAFLKPICADGNELIACRNSFSEELGAVAEWYVNQAGIHEPFNAVGISQPFLLAYHPYDNRELLMRYGAQCATWMKTLAMEEPSVVSPRPFDGVRKIRVGVVSAHVHDHSVWNAIASGWVHQLDRSKFEVEVFQLKPASDQETERARRAADRFETEAGGLVGWVRLLRSRQLDVLFYPEIGMDPLTLQLAALRLAPVQAASWGHPETTGLPTIDIYVSGESIEPAAAADNYSETLVRLPNLGVCVEPRNPQVAKPRLRALSLPRGEPLLLCPGSPFKYSPLDDDVWVQIAMQLRKVLWRRSSGGRLVFFRSRSDTMDRMLESRLRAAFIRHDVEFDAHVSIVPNLERARFYGLMNESALLLDTLGFSGFNTAIQAIECGLPVLAYEGEFMRGRLASAIMRRLDLVELVAENRAEFVDKAVRLARHPAARRALRRKIKQRRHVLFNDMLPIRALENELEGAVAGAVAVNEREPTLPSAAGR